MRYRERDCDLEAFGNMTKDCEGDPVENGASCHTFACDPRGRHRVQNFINRVFFRKVILSDVTVNLFT